jgi:hypothetical protein
MAFQTLGSGTITITSLNATRVAGYVDLVLVPTAGATTNRAIAGSFDIAITAPGCRSPGGTFAGGPPPGGIGGPGVGVATTGTLTALIDGAGFNGALVLSATLVNGILSVAGADEQHALQLVVGGVAGPGTFPIGPTSATTAALAQNGTALTWLAGPTIGSGSITVTSLTATAVTGTFTLTLGPTAAAAGIRTITNGVFDVPLAASLPVPPSVPVGPAVPAGGAPTGLVALIDRIEWRPAGLGQATRTPQGYVTIAGVDVQARGLSMAIFGSAVGTYSLESPNSHNALYSAGSQMWFTSRPGGGGSVTIASISTTQITGSFTLTLVPGPTNSDQRTLVVTGTFDLPF